MKKILRFGWIIVLDLVAVTLLLFALIFGWLPGTPGIPIALAGLGLLAINHDWAERLLTKGKLHLKVYLQRLKNLFKSKA